VFYSDSFPVSLNKAEYRQLYYHLQLTADVHLPRYALTQLRRELLFCLRDYANASFVTALTGLLRPPLPDDPVLQRQVQKPAPAVIISPDPSCYGSLRAGTQIVLPVLFLGPAIHAVDDFGHLLRLVAARGIYNKSGVCCLVKIEQQESDLSLSTLWEPGTGSATAPAICDLGWWLEQQLRPVEMVRFELLSPMRLLQQGKPIFKATFTDLFATLLRRVTSLLSQYCGIENICDDGDYAGSARRVEVVAERLKWRDWKLLQGDGGRQSLGGVTGDLVLSGGALADILWLLLLASRFNAGKGASFGCGQFRIVPLPAE